MSFFDSVKAQLKTYCPKCKTEIFRHAYVCPKCGYDLNSPAYKKRKDTEIKYIRYWLYVCIFILVVSLFSDSNPGVAIVLCILLFGAGVFCIGKISKISDFFH